MAAGKTERKAHRAGGYAAWVMVGLLAYVLSIGPAATLLGWWGHNETVTRMHWFVYDPVLYVDAHGPVVS